MQSQKPLNIVFIRADELRYDTMAVYGNEKINTPNFNRLAEESAVFKTAYVSQPACTPSRATVITGQYPHTHGLTVNNMCLSEDKPSIAKLVKKQGYKTAYMGIWHLGNEVIPQHGFDEWISSEDGYRKYYSEEEYKSINCSYYHYLNENGFMPDKEEEGFSYFSRQFATRLPEEYSKPAFVTKEAIKYIKKNKDERFVLFASYLEPHPPYYSVNDDMYDPDKIDLPECFDFELGEDMPLKYELKRRYAREVGRHYPLKDEKTWRKQIARYWGSVSLIDKCVGKILDAIKENGLYDNTIVVLTSDHGDMMGDYKMLAKEVMFEKSVRVPLLIKVPGVTNKQVIIDKPVSQVDLMPTLLDMIDVPGCDEIQGKSLYPVIKGDKKLEDNDVFIEFQNGVMKEGNKLYDKLKKTVTQGDMSPGIEELLNKCKKIYSKPTAERAVVTSDGWKLSLKQSGEHELYDLNDDPYEQKNLYFIGICEDEIERLKDKIHKWQEETGDTAEI